MYILIIIITETTQVRPKKEFRVRIYRPTAVTRFIFLLELRLS